MYYDVNKTLSRERLFNFVVGPRGVGKTYAAKKRVISRFLKNGEQFVYIRRYETELPAAEMRNFFDDIQIEFEGHEFKAYNGLFRIDDKIAGWYIALSTATMLKSIPFPKVSLIIFDEFIIDVGMYRYLPNEVKTFLECYSTISRDRDVPVLFLSNAITITNPYFIYFDIRLEQEQTVKLTKFISVEMVQSNEYKRHLENTKFGQLIAETDYGKYHTENKFLLDTETFIEKLPPRSAYICTFRIEGKSIGYYISSKEQKWFLSNKFDETCRRIYTLSINEHAEDSYLAQRANPYIRQLVNSYCTGNLRFSTMEVKNLMITALRRMI